MMTSLLPHATSLPPAQWHSSDPHFERWLERATDVLALADLRPRGCEQATPLSWHVPAACIGNVRAADPAARSALLAACCGRLAPATGSVRIGGFDLWRSHGAQRSLFLLSWVGQVLCGDRLDDYLSVRDNLMLPLLIAGEQRPHALKRVLHQLEVFDLAECAGRSPADLSEQQHWLAVLCRALVVEPTVLFVEAPEQRLDAAYAERVRQCLGKVVHEHCTCVVIASEDDHFGALAQTTLWVR